MRPHLPPRGWSSSRGPREDWRLDTSNCPRLGAWPSRTPASWAWVPSAVACPMTLDQGISRPENKKKRMRSYTMNSWESNQEICFICLVPSNTLYEAQKIDSAMGMFSKKKSAESRLLVCWEPAKSPRLALRHASWGQVVHQEWPQAEAFLRQEKMTSFLAVTEGNMVAGLTFLTIQIHNNIILERQICECRFIHYYPHYLWNIWWSTYILSSVLWLSYLMKLRKIHWLWRNLSSSQRTKHSISQVCYLFFHFQQVYRQYPLRDHI